MSFGAGVSDSLAAAVRWERVSCQSVNADEAVLKAA